ncbi:MAG TPA: hypothetical protein VFN30_04270 [Chitinophagaceae bacterium]|nr:hypothetical protein [Chitinophagaceae bacterium]
MLIKRRKKIIAFFFLLVYSVQFFYPTVSFALTNGPTQPEMQKFEPAGVSDMVDLFSGDFKYNIPLLDVGGYPINISYGSGTGMDDEASWVGTGWTLNPGAVNRTMRGLPDDFDGTKGDEIKKEYSKKDFKKIGAQVVVKPSLATWEIGKPSLKLNVYKDNYWGIGASVGASLGFNLAKNNATSLTAGLSLDVNSDVRNGVDIKPSLSLSGDYDFKNDVNAGGNLSGSLLYNTRGGLKSVSLSASFSATEIRNNEEYTYLDYEKSATHYFGQSYTPAINTNSLDEGYTLSADLGLTFFGVYAGVGASGYVYTQKNLDKNISVPAYGYMNYSKARKKLEALLDFNREKDGVFITSAPSIAIPVATNDFFVASGQTGSQQFRPHYGGNYVVFDKLQTNTSVNASTGITIGGGNIVKWGGRVDATAGESKTQKWVSNNFYLNAAEPYFNNIGEEPVYFKQVGEKVQADKSYYDQFGDATIRKVLITGARWSGAFAQPVLESRAPVSNINFVNQATIKKSKREKRVYGFSYLTNEEAQKYALDKTIGGIQRNADAYRKPHHISDITVTDNDGKRMVYGIPVYNILQEEVSFAYKLPGNSNVEKVRRTGIVNYSPYSAGNLITNRNGRDWHYSKETTPGFATSYLLTGVLSPDYVDATGDGITDDDLGTAVKFNYTRLTNNVNRYKWRAPYGYKTANYNEAFQSDPKDDKANFVYGEKEIWYLNSIESKTMIAIVETSNREDGLGVLGVDGGANNSLKLKKIDRIKLYSKADWIKNGNNAVPIKTAHFEYDYSLYPGVLNNTGTPINVNGNTITDPQQISSPDINVNFYKGKLTLKRIYFTFGNNSRGKSNAYEFYYDSNNKVTDGIANLPPITNTQDEEFNDVYTERQTDRWGTYKKSFYNRVINGQRSLNNSEFSFVPQQNDNTGYDERKLADHLASKWQLNKIITPSGGIINVEYESDDYAYVQNRKAMQMCFLKGVDAVAPNGQNIISGFINQGKNGIKKLVVDLPRPVANTDEFKKTYMTEQDGRLLDKIFYKIYTDLNYEGRYEYVNGYAEINWSETSASGNTAYIAINKQNEYNPVVTAAWQMLRTDLPQYAYGGYDNSDADNFGEDFLAAILSILHSIGDLKEITQPFERTAEDKRFADNIDLTRSMVRLIVPPHYDEKINADKLSKIGGGSRVRKVEITDQWREMTGINEYKTAKYGQVYDYTKKDYRGRYISSGVASYEPQIGNEENPFHEPINFTEKVHWSSDRNHFIEKPFCETYFPAASVGYSVVKVTSFGDDYSGSGAVVNNSTGYTENEFYTAKDFPTKVDYLPLTKQPYENSLIVKLFSAVSIKRLAVSQGFKVELNDMHGKPKSVKVFNKAGDLVTSTEYYYRVKDQNAEEKELDNDNIDLLSYRDDQNNTGVNDGSIIKGTLATDIDFTTDMRESANNNYGVSIGAYTGSTIFPFFFPLYLHFGSVKVNGDITLDTYNSASAVKVINRFGIVTKVVTTQNGSTISAENLLWDAETGEVLLTATQNEFDKYTYSFNYPAHLVNEYEGMGGAYKNLGITFTDFSTFTNGKIDPGKITVLQQQQYLFPGDELVALGTNNKKGWLIAGPFANSNDRDLRLIDEKGNFIQASGPWMVIRSGYRNLLKASAGSVVTLKDPRVNGRIVLDVDRKILDSKAVVFNNEWSIPVNNIYGDTTITPQSDCANIDPFCLRRFLLSASSFTTSTSPVNRRGIFSFQNDGNTVGTFLTQASAIDQNTVCQNSFIDNNPASSFAYYLLTPHYNAATGKYYLQNGDEAIMGNYKIVFDNVNSEYNNLVNSSTSDVTQFNGLNNSLAPFSSAYKYCVFRQQGCNFFLNRIDFCEDPSIQGNTEKQQLNSPSVSTNPCYVPTYCTLSTVLLSFHIEKLPTTILACLTPIDKPINPYYKDVLGNWVPLMNYVYTVHREQKPGNPNQIGGTDIRNSGTYTTYAPFWNWQNNQLKRTFSDGQSLPITDPLSRWVWSNRSVYYDQKGNEIENVDALNRYGSALYGYRQSVATAVAANARHNEIAFDGFEDYDFDLQSNLVENCPLERHLEFGFTKQGGIWTSPGGIITNQYSHTGKYSYQLNGTTTIVKAAGGASPPTQILDFDAQGRRILKANELARGFSPINGKKYLLSFWVKDNAENINKIQGLTLKINGVDKQVNNIVVPVVEGWKRLEIPFTAGSLFLLELTATGSIYLDDIRMFPNEGQMNSYVYDDRSLRLMAQLDENNFATLYEYDDEGTPIRVKKETERGVMTLRESRQSLRQRN